MKKKNLSRKIKVAHITLKGHDITIPDELLDAARSLFLCREYGAEKENPHTHVGVLLDEPRRARDLIDSFAGVNPTGGHPDLGSANNFETILGYHLGLGGKPRCPATL